MSAQQSTIAYKLIPGFPYYRVGDDGSVWTRRVGGNRRRLGSTWEQMKPTPDDAGYLQTQLCPGKVSRRIHTLVLLAFVGPCPEGMECCHGDGDKTNNRLNNLRWGTHSENMQDAMRHGLLNPRPPRSGLKGEANRRAKLTSAKIRRIRSEYAKGKSSQRRLAVEYNVSQFAIWGIISGKRWKHI